MIARRAQLYDVIGQRVAADADFERVGAQRPPEGGRPDQRARAQEQADEFFRRTAVGVAKNVSYDHVFEQMLRIVIAEELGNAA